MTSEQASRIRSGDGVRAAIAAAYAALPVLAVDGATRRAFAAFRDEVRKQFAFLTEVLRIDVSTSARDPYGSVEEMVADLRDGRLVVLATTTTGSHPWLGDDDNDMFRAVHDVFGHSLIGRGFDRHGEEAAWAVHSQMFPGPARHALTTETRGQSAAMIESIGAAFAVQKVGLLPPGFTSPGTVCFDAPTGAAKS
jgi:hypothetical protein